MYWNFVSIYIFFTVRKIRVFGPLLSTLLRHNKKNFFPFKCIPHIVTLQKSKLSVNTLCSSLSAEFSRHCVLSDGTQRRIMPCYQSEEIKTLKNNTSPKWESIPQRFTVTRLCHCATTYHTK